MKLDKIVLITGKIKLLTGLHIGSGDAGMKIGGIDSPVIKHPINNEPYIPGSSIKGKVRSMLELLSGDLVDGAPISWKKAKSDAGKSIVKLFGNSADNKLTLEEAEAIGPTRVSFWDCNLNKAWAQQIKDNGFLLTEEKSENRIDRIKGTAEHPRFIERVPAETEFDFKLTIKVFDKDSDALFNHLLIGLKLLTLDGLGGSTSRGYGKIELIDLEKDGISIQEDFSKITLS